MNLSNIKWISFTSISIAVLTACTAGVQFKNSNLSQAAQSSGTTSVTPPGSGGGGTTGGSTCTPESLTVPAKIMFVVDTSGSNVWPTMDEGYEECDPSVNTCAPPTDPNKTFRSGSISNFFNLYKGNSVFSWSFLTFSNDTVTSYVGSNSNPQFGNAAAMTSAITQFNAETDNGDTPYIAALNAAQNAIANDPDLNSTAVNAANYYVVFLSDGFPTDALNADGSVNESQIDSAVAALVALAPGRVKVSTVYYGTINDPVAAGTLQGMATSGSGQFVNVNTSSTSTIQIQDLIQLPCSN